MKKLLSILAFLPIGLFSQSDLLFGNWITAARISKYDTVQTTLFVGRPNLIDEDSIINIEKGFIVIGYTENTYILISYLDKDKKEFIGPVIVTML